jgi:hypothetical protein
VSLPSAQIWHSAWALGKHTTPPTLSRAHASTPTHTTHSHTHTRTHAAVPPPPRRRAAGGGGARPGPLPTPAPGASRPTPPPARPGVRLSDCLSGKSTRGTPGGRFVGEEGILEPRTRWLRDDTRV